MRLATLMCLLTCAPLAVLTEVNNYSESDARSFRRPSVDRVWVTRTNHSRPFNKQFSDAIRNFAYAIKDPAAFLRFLKEAESQFLPKFEEMRRRSSGPRNMTHGRTPTGGRNGDSLEGLSTLHIAPVTYRPALNSRYHEEYDEFTIPLRQTRGGRRHHRLAPGGRHHYLYYENVEAPAQTLLPPDRRHNKPRPQSDSVRRPTTADMSQSETYADRKQTSAELSATTGSSVRYKEQSQEATSGFRQVKLSSNKRVRHNKEISASGHEAGFISDKKSHAQQVKYVEDDYTQEKQSTIVSTEKPSAVHREPEVRAYRAGGRAHRGHTRFTIEDYRRETEGLEGPHGDLVNAVERHTRKHETHASAASAVKRAQVRVADGQFSGDAADDHKRRTTKYAPETATSGEVTSTAVDQEAMFSDNYGGQARLESAVTKASEEKAEVANVGHVRGRLGKHVPREYKELRLTEAESTYYRQRQVNMEPFLIHSTDYGPIPGVAGKDYPDYSQPPRSTFPCDRPGYFADVSTRCQAFHFCAGNGVGEAMLCPNGTLFNEDVLVCDWWFNVDCSVQST